MLLWFFNQEDDNIDKFRNNRAKEPTIDSDKFGPKFPWLEFWHLPSGTGNTLDLRRMLLKYTPLQRYWYQSEENLHTVALKRVVLKNTVRQRLDWLKAEAAKTGKEVLKTSSSWSTTTCFKLIRLQGKALRNYVAS